MILKADRGLVRYLSNEEEILRAKEHAKSYKTRGVVTMVAACVSGGAAAGLGGYIGVGLLTGAIVGGTIAAPLFLGPGVGLIIFGLWCGNKLMNKGAKLLEEPTTREALNQIMKEALLAYDKRDFQKFFDVVSKE